MAAFITTVISLGCSDSDSPEVIAPANKSADRHSELTSIPVTSGPNVLLITIDTLRADRLTAYGATSADTPNLDRLAEEGTLFEAAISPMQMTRPSHYSIFTSLYPRDHGVVNNKIGLEPRFTTLMQVFRRAGYQTAAVVAVSLLGAQSGVETAFDYFSAPAQGGPPVRSADQVVAEVRRWLDRSSRDRPYFLWVHLFDPHTPYEPPAEFAPEPLPTEYGAMKKVTMERLIEISLEHGGDLPESAVKRAVDLYQGDVHFADHWLGVLIEKLRREGSLDETIIALTADHGECFENGIYFEHADCLYEGAARVPMIFRHPASVPAGARRSEVVELLDVAPTLLSLAGVPTPEEFQGRDLFDPDDAPRGKAFLQHPLYSNVGVQNRQVLRLQSVMGQPTKGLLFAEEQLGIRTVEWKYIVTGDREELYDLELDPGESKNLAQDRPEVTARLRAELDAWSSKHPQYHGDVEQINDEMKATLKALGYLQ